MRLRDALMLLRTLAYVRDTADALGDEALAAAVDVQVTDVLDHVWQLSPAARGDGGDPTSVICVHSGTECPVS